MANDIPEVYIRVVADTGEVERNLTAAERAFLKFQQSTKKGSRGWGNRFTKDFAKMAAGVFAVSTAMSTLSSVARRMVADVSAFQVMKVQLEVATGSVVLAEQAFSMLQGTAKKLPGSLKDLTTGFIRLKNMGLDASEDSLISFSNTAAAMGKSLKQFVEAVADANTREFERLKEFGILARNQGDTIKFVFRGATTEVENSSKHIVKFLTDIGKTEFAGAATKQIDTLAARFTKLQDSIFNLNIAFGDGASGALGDFLKFLTEAADKAADSKSLSIVRDKLLDVSKAMTSASGGTYQPLLIPKKTKLDVDGVLVSFSQLAAKHLPAANTLIKEMERNLTKMHPSVQQAERGRIDSVKLGIKIAKARLDSEIAYAEYLVSQQVLHAKNNRLKDQGFQITKDENEVVIERLLTMSKENGDITTLNKLKIGFASELAVKARQIQKHRTTEVISETGLAVLLREKNGIVDKIWGIEDAILQINEKTAAAKAKAAKEAKTQADALARTLKHQTAFLKEHGSIEAFNTKMAAERILTTRVALGVNIELTEALNDKHAELSDKIKVIQDKLAAKGMGTKEVEDANKELATLTSGLDSVTIAIRDQKDELTEWQKSMVGLFDDIKEGIADAIIEGEGFKGLISSILKQIAKTQIVNMLGGLGGPLPALFKKPKGAFTGGPVSSGIPRIVGEKGPEIFTPSGAGMITPNHRVGGRGGSTVVNTYNTFDIRGSEQEVQQMIASSVELSVNLAVSRNQDLKNRGSIR